MVKELRVCDGTDDLVANLKENCGVYENPSNDTTVPDYLFVTYGKYFFMVAPDPDEPGTLQYVSDDFTLESVREVHLRRAITEIFTEKALSKWGIVIDPQNPKVNAWANG